LSNIFQVIFVVPCFNEEKRLDSEAFLLFCRDYPSVHFCFVDDGSKDGTAHLLENLHKANSMQIQFLQLSKNQGKAEAVRQGILHTAKQKQFAYIGYLDADLATPLCEIPFFVELVKQNPHLILIAGSRISRMGASIERYLFRHYFGRVFATIVSAMLNLRFYDTQCGAKLLKSGIVEEIFNEPFISPWLFDVEMIFRIMKAKGLTNPASLIYELPLNQWEEKGASKIKLIDLIKIPIELWKIGRKYR
jgi:glycosyltransferase involved in cell wall biosynthesis